MLENTFFLVTLDTATGTPEREGSNRRPHCVRIPMMRSFGIRMALRLAPQAWNPFITQHTSLWQHTSIQKAFAGVVRANGHRVRHQGDGILHVSVSEGDLQHMARTKECKLPGVNFVR